jgi:hypothetical protein
LIFALLAAGLAGKHDPSAGTIDRYAVREAAWLRPFGRLQDTHEQGFSRNDMDRGDP